MAISRMQEPRQLMNNGGILTLEDAKRMAPPGESLAYINKDEAKLLKSLGGAGEDINGTGIKSYFIKKALKKATRAVKKIVKSPIGKAAIIGGLGMWGMGAGPFSGLKGAGWLKGLGAKSMMNMGPLRGTAAGKGWLGRMAGGVGNWWGGLSGGQKLFTGLAGASLAAPFLMGKDEPEEEVEEAWTSIPSSIADIRNQARNFYRNPDESTLAFMPGKQFVQPNFYAADGGRAGLMNGGEPGQEQIEQMLMAEFVKYKNQGGTLTFEQFVQAIMQQQQEGQGMEQPQEVAMANGGSVPGSTVPGYTTPAGHNRFDYYSGGDPVRVGAYAGGPMSEDEDEYAYNPQAAMRMYKRPGKQEGGIMETEVADEMIDLGGQEKDYRETGGFVEIGGKERADDVPARLSKNEFVFTADAVRAAGGGDIDKGSEVMQNLMDNLEAGGEVSEESQGLEGAQAMYDQQQMLQSRMI